MYETLITMFSIPISQYSLGTPPHVQPLKLRYGIVRLLLREPCQRVVYCHHVVIMASAGQTRLVAQHMKPSSLDSLTQSSAMASTMPDLRAMTVLQCVVRSSGLLNNHRPRSLCVGHFLSASRGGPNHRDASRGTREAQRGVFSLG